MINFDTKEARTAALLCSLAILIPVFGHSLLYQIGTSEAKDGLSFGLPIYNLATAPGKGLLLLTPWSPLQPNAADYYWGPLTEFELYVVTMVASAVGWLGIFLLLGWLLRVVRRGVAKGVPAKS